MKKLCFLILIVLALTGCAESTATTETQTERAKISKTRAEETKISVEEITADATIFPVLDSASFDIDGDGKDERFAITFGWTSGISSYIVNMSDTDGNTQSVDIYPYSGEPSFYADDGEFGLLFTTETEEGIKTERYIISIADGKLNAELCEN